MKLKNLQFRRCCMHIVLMILFFSVQVYAENEADNYPKIKAIIKPETATVGDVVEYRVNVAGKDLKDIDILLPEKRELYPEKNSSKDKKEFSEKKMKPSDEIPLYIIHNVKKEDKSEKSLMDITVVMQLSYYRPGKHTLPEIEMLDSDKIKIGYKVPVIEIKELNKDGGLEEIEPPLELGGNYYRLVFLLLGIIALTALSIFLFRYIKMRREKGEKTLPIIPPVELFLKEIEQLNAKSLIADNKIEEYVFGISMIFRKFLSLQLNFDAAEMTTDEIEKTLKRLNRTIYNKYNIEIMNSFHLWDLSKFAEFVPSHDILSVNLERTIDIAQKIAKDMENDIPRV